MFRKILLMCICVLALPGCTTLGIAAGAGATTGIAAAQEGGLSRAVDDARIQIEINDLWFKYDIETFRKLDLTINQGRVLITGVVQDPEHRVEAVRLAWQPKGVQQVINEIQVAESEGIVGFAKDTWITTRLRTALTFDREVLSINYSIDTVRGTVYLMGFAQNRAELNRVIETARTINGVNGVVSYVKFVGGDQPVPSGPSNDGVNYQSTYDDNYVYQTQQGQSVPVQPYEDPTPLNLRAPQANTGLEGGAQPSYPNNVDPMFSQEPAPAPAVSEPIIIRQDTANYPMQRQGIESEEILWNDQ